MAAPSASFVFKLHYDDGPVHVSRRYGYTGRIDQPQVYSGLFDRTSQVLSLPTGTFTLALKDSLGKPTIKLNSFKDFREYVCKPLVQDPNGVKIDEKGRRVLVFIVEKKKKPEELSNSNSTSTTTTPRGVVSPSTPRSVQTDTPSTTTSTTTGEGGSVVTDYSPLSTGGKNAFDKLSKRFELPGGVEKSGYHTSYSNTTTTTTSASKGGVDKEKESWGTVKGMLENFVKDLNLHLADTFGDEAGNFRLKTHHEDVAVVEEKKKEKEEEIKTIPVQVKALHPHVFCDRCLKTIIGSRFKCRSCSNYDLCETCIDFRTQFHPGVHTFSEIVRPGSTPLPSIRGQVEMEQRPRPTLTPTPSMTTTTIPPPSVRPVIHNATCDVCQKTIQGVRMKCLDCPDYDTCLNCYNNPSSPLSSIHPLHNFVSIHHPNDLKFNTSPPSTSTIHHHVRCDGCQKSPIRGNRYKCVMTSCKDFDLCQECESDPIPRHPLDHHLLKIRKPINQLLLFGGVGGSFNETVKRAQEVANRGVGVGGSNPITSLISSIGAVVQAHTTQSATPIVQQHSTPTVQTTTGTSTTEKEKEQEIEVEVKVEQSESESEPEQENVQDVSSRTSSAEEEGDRLGCSFVADVTLQDGTVVPAGSEFNKIWKVKNTGTVTWNKVKLVNVGGLQSTTTTTVKGSSEVLLDLKPGEECEVLVECKAPEEDGRFMSFFRLQDQNGNKFGDRFWLDITVESQATTLSSSSIITPSLEVGGKSSAPTTVPESFSSAAPSTTFSLSSGLEGEEESEYESIQLRQGTRRSGGFIESSDEEEEEVEEEMSQSESESEESSELEEEEDSDDEFVVLSEEDR